MARGWLRDAPSPAQFRAGFALLRRLRDQVDEPLFTPSDLLESVLWASSAAQLDREELAGGYGPVSSTARGAIRELETWLAVDVGDLWADVLAELGEELPRSGNVLPPRFKTLPDSSRHPAAPASEVPRTTLGHARAHLAVEYPAPGSVPFPLVRRTGT